MRNLNFAKIISLTLLLLFGLIFSKGGLDLKAGALLSSQAQAATCRNIGWCNVGQKGSPCGANQFCASCVGGEYICYDECPPGTAPKCSGPCISCEPVGPPVCTPGTWANAGCGKGGCAPDQMYQTRTCNPAGCCTTEQCVSDPSCAKLPPSSYCPLLDAGGAADSGYLTTPAVIDVFDATLGSGTCKRLVPPKGPSDGGEALCCALNTGIYFFTNWFETHLENSFGYSNRADFSADRLTPYPNHPIFRELNTAFLSEVGGTAGFDGYLARLLPPGYTEGGVDVKERLTDAQGQRVLGQLQKDEGFCKYGHNAFEGDDRSADYCNDPSQLRVYHYREKVPDVAPAWYKTKLAHQTLMPPGTPRAKLPQACQQALGDSRVILIDAEEADAAGIPTPEDKIVHTYLDLDRGQITGPKGDPRTRRQACADCRTLAPCIIPPNISPDNPLACFSCTLPASDPRWDPFKACVQNYCSTTGTVTRTDTHSCDGAPARARLCTSAVPPTCFIQPFATCLGGLPPCIDLRLDENAHQFCDNPPLGDTNACWTTYSTITITDTTDCDGDGNRGTEVIGYDFSGPATCGVNLPACYQGIGNFDFKQSIDSRTFHDTTGRTWEVLASSGNPTAYPRAGYPNPSQGLASSPPQGEKSQVLGEALPAFSPIDLLDYMVPDDGQGNFMTNGEFFYGYTEGNRLLMRKSCDPRWYESFEFDSNMIYLRKDTTWNASCRDNGSEASGVYFGGGNKRYWSFVGEEFTTPPFDLVGEAKFEPTCRTCETQWTGKGLRSTFRLTHYWAVNGPYTFRDGSVTIDDAIVLMNVGGPGSGDGYVFSKSMGWVGFTLTGVHWDGRRAPGLPIQEGCPIPSGPDPALIIPGCGFSAPPIGPDDELFEGVVQDYFPPEKGGIFRALVATPAWGEFVFAPGEVTGKATFQAQASVTGVPIRADKESNVRIPIAPADTLYKTYQCVVDQALEPPSSAVKGACESATNNRIPTAQASPQESQGVLGEAEGSNDSKDSNLSNSSKVSRPAGGGRGPSFLAGANNGGSVFAKLGAFLGGIVSFILGLGG